VPLALTEEVAEEDLIPLADEPIAEGLTPEETAGIESELAQVKSSYPNTGRLLIQVQG